MNFLEGLLILFVALKLTGVIAWSWWWVLSPITIPLVVVLGGGGIALLGCYAFELFRK